jgi:hypothetical protein
MGTWSLISFPGVKRPGRGFGLYLYLYPTSRPSWLVIVWITYLLTYLLSHSMEQCASWEDNRFSVSQEIPPHFMEPEDSLPHSQVPATCPSLPILSIMWILPLFYLYQFSNPAVLFGIRRGFRGSPKITFRVVYKAFVLHTHWIPGSNLVPESR